jgi:putative chitinase
MGNKNPGDGWRFIGRGLMQTTGRYNYERLAEIVNMPVDEMPEWLETREGAADSAAIFWHSKNCNDVADAGAVDRCRHRINGGLIGIDDVRSRYATALGLLT